MIAQGPLAALLLMAGSMKLALGAGATRVRRGELQMLPVNTVPTALALFIAIERFGPHSL